MSLVQSRCWGAQPGAGRGPTCAPGHNTWREHTGGASGREATGRGARVAQPAGVIGPVVARWQQRPQVGVSAVPARPGSAGHLGPPATAGPAPPTVDVRCPAPTAPPTARGWYPTASSRPGRPAAQPPTAHPRPALTRRPPGHGAHAGGTPSSRIGPLPGRGERCPHASHWLWLIGVLLSCDIHPRFVPGRDVPQGGRAGAAEETAAHSTSWWRDEVRDGCIAVACRERAPCRLWRR